MDQADRSGAAPLTAGDKGIIAYSLHRSDFLLRYCCRQFLEGRSLSVALSSVGALRLEIILMKAIRVILIATIFRYE